MKGLISTIELALTYEVYDEEKVSRLMELHGTHQTECKCHLYNQVKQGENSWRRESSQRGGRSREEWRRRRGVRGNEGWGRVEERRGGVGESAEGGGEEGGTRRGRSTGECRRERRKGEKLNLLTKQYI